MGYISNQPLHAPCQSSSNSGGTDVRCTTPIDHLTTRGVLVSWFSEGRPGLTLQTADGAATTLGEHQAKVYSGKPTDQCKVIGGTVSLVATILAGQETTNDDLIVGDACLANAMDEASIRTLLSSVRVG